MSTLFKTSTFLLLIVMFIGWGCTTSEKTTDDDQPELAAEESPEITDDELSEFQITLAENRSKLRDLYVSQTHDMPEAFLKTDSNNGSINRNPRDGYRVQILSTRDQPLADSVANEFRMWADTTITGYDAEAYISFNQPFYRVHIGDFQQRDQANSFSQLIKPNFPDAWVVHDRIEPSNAPADTATFSFKEDVDEEGIDEEKEHHNEVDESEKRENSSD